MITTRFRIALLCAATLALHGCGTGRIPLPIPSPDTYPDNAYYRYLEAQELSRSGEPERAEASLRAAIEMDPESSYLKRELALLYAQQEKHDQALELLSEVIASDPDDIEALLLAGRIYQSQERLEEAKAAYREAVEKGGPEENVYLILGNLYFQDGEYDDAEAVFSLLVERMPDSYAGYFFLGKVYLEQENEAAAETAFEKALGLEPELESARFELIDLLRYRDDTPANRKRILGLYQEILEQDDLNVQAVTGLAVYYRDIGKPREAEALLRDLSAGVSDEEIFRSILKFYIERDRYEDAAYVLETLLKINPGNSNYHFLAGLAFEKSEDLERALWHYQRVSPNSRRYRDAVLQATLLYHSSGQTREAISYLGKVIEQEPDNPELYLYLGQLYEEVGDYPAAERELLEAVRLGPESDKAHFDLAVLYDKMGRKEEAIATLKKVIEINPKHANALNYLGYTYADLGIRLDEAEDLIQRALALKPGDGYFTDSLGWVYYQKGQYEKALETLLEASRLAPDDPIIMEHVGDAYLKTGNRSKALEYYLKSIEIDAEGREALQEKIRGLGGDAPGAGEKP